MSDLLASKKFLFTLLTTVLVLAASKYGALDRGQVLQVLQLLLPAYLASQGLADMGKHAAAVNAQALVGTPMPPEPETQPELPKET